MGRWLRFFRAVNLPTVPGDVLAGASLGIVAANGCLSVAGAWWLPIVAASVASVLLYMFGLADNDIVGADCDGGERPIPAGEITLSAARIARCMCLFGALIVGAACDLRAEWWIAAFLLSVAIVVYNRTKWSVLMGLCRGLNLLCGGFAIAGSAVLSLGGVPLAAVAAIWILYISAVTMYSTGEEHDPQKRLRVGALIGGIVYLQLAVLLLGYVRSANVLSRWTLIAGAVLLVVLRIMRRMMPKVSAS